MSKFLLCTDIHLGRRNNSLQHLQDCEDYFDWFIKQAISRKATDIAFLGDFFESRASMSIITLDYAYKILKKLNNLGLPVWFIVGNHDLYRRSTREVFSTNVFNELHNFQVINEPLNTGKLSFAPFLFEEEYPNYVASVQKSEYIFGHFEFKGFLISGYNTVMAHGPEHVHLKNAKLIMSGHYHTRQAKDNCVYIGNTFPLTYGDLDDAHGAAYLDTDTGHFECIDWVECPKFRKITLSNLLNGDVSFGDKTNVKCIADINIEYSVAQALRDSVKTEWNLRDFILESDMKAQHELIAGEEEVLSEEYLDIDSTVVDLLDSMDTESVYANQKLISIYKGLI